MQDTGAVYRVNYYDLCCNLETEEGALVGGSAVVPVLYCNCGYTMLFSP
jgi:hypothetical protein